MSFSAIKIGFLHFKVLVKALLTIDIALLPLFIGTNYLTVRKVAVLMIHVSPATLNWVAASGPGASSVGLLSGIRAANG